MFKDYMGRLSPFKGLGKEVLKGKLNHVAVAPNIRLDSGSDERSDSDMKKIDKLLDVCRLQIEKNIPILTLNLRGLEKNTYVLKYLFEKLEENEEIHKNKVKVYILGKWYDLEGVAVNAMKKLIEETKDYDQHFLNLCVNYNGHEEIVDACKILSKKVVDESMTTEEIDELQVKDNLYSSYFIPPDLMLVYGEKQSLGGFLLWDSANCNIKFMKKKFSDFLPKDIEGF